MTKEDPSLKLQDAAGREDFRRGFLEIRNWSFFGAWNLVIGAFQPYAW